MKKIVSLFIAALFVALLMFSSFAAESDTRVFDKAGLLTKDERLKLEALLAEKRAEDDFDTVIVTAHHIDDIEQYAENFYDNGGYGVGRQRDGVLLVITDDDGYILTTGIGIDAVDPYISELSMDYHRLADKKKYYAAFEGFVYSVSEKVTQWREYEENNSGSIDIIPIFASGTVQNKALLVIIPLAVGIIVALIVTSSMKRQLKSVRSKTRAYDCIRSGSMHVTRAYDHFLYRTVTKTPRPTETSDPPCHGSMPSGGGSTHVGSSGTTHGGGHL